MSTPLIINEMFAFIAPDALGEGLVAFQMPSGEWMPLVGADMTRVESLKPIARKIGKMSGKKIQLVKFTTRIHLEDIT